MKRERKVLILIDGTNLYKIIIMTSGWSLRPVGVLRNDGLDCILNTQASISYTTQIVPSTFTRHHTRHTSSLAPLESSRRNRCACFTDRERWLNEEKREAWGHMAGRWQAGAQPQTCLILDPELSILVCEKGPSNTKGCVQSAHGRHVATGSRQPRPGVGDTQGTFDRLVWRLWFAWIDYSQSYGTAH